MQRMQMNSNYDIRAVLFDLHYTLTTTKSTIPQMLRQILNDNGLNADSITDLEIKNALFEADGHLAPYQVKNNVDIHWGADPEDWLPFDRIFLENLRFSDISDETLLKIEKEFKYITRDSDWEYFTDDALGAVHKLKELGYLLGICTRRNDDPKNLLNRSGLTEFFDTIQWSGVAGYAKPSPFTLLEAAKDLGVNPRLCAFVGNYVGADIEAALRAEMLPVLLTWATPHEAEKAPEGCLVFEHPTDFVTWLQLHQNSK